MTLIDSELYVSVQRFFRRRIGEGHEDLVHDTFVRLLECSGRKKVDGLLRAYTIGIARHVLCSHISRSTRARMNPINQKSSIAGSEGCVEGSTFTLSIVRALSALPSHQRQAFLLHHIEDLSDREVAEVLRIPLGTAKSLIRGARAALRESLTSQTQRRHNGFL